jgi:hypothetical protein
MPENKIECYIFDFIPNDYQGDPIPAVIEEDSPALKLFNESWNGMEGEVNHAQWYETPGWAILDSNYLQGKTITFKNYIGQLFTQ